MIGTGRATIAQVGDLARAIVSDGLPHEALQAFASLGGGGRHPSNQERDLHRWISKLFGCQLETYKVMMDVYMPLSCFQYTLYVYIHTRTQMKHVFSYLRIPGKVEHEEDPQLVEIPFVSWKTKRCSQTQCAARKLLAAIG